MELVVEGEGLFSRTINIDSLIPLTALMSDGVAAILFYYQCKKAEDISLV